MTMTSKGKPNNKILGKRRIAIIGAGQAGLQLGCGLLQRGYAVDLFTARTAEEIYNGPILSTQTIFHDALATERKLGLNFWDAECPQNVSISLAVGGPDLKSKIIEWTGLMNQPYQSVDQRIKFPHWMNYFEKLGGNIAVQNIEVGLLDEIAKAHDLTIVATGKGKISNIFPVDEYRTVFENPQRVVTCLYVLNVKPVPSFPGSRVCLIPSIGEYFSTPGLTLQGPCEMIQFEGVLGGPLDCWNEINTPEAYLERALTLLKTYVPWEYERCVHMRLTDERAMLTGSFRPTVRHPIAFLPSGKSVLGIADAVVLNDPIAAQGANSAAKAADFYLESIVKRGSKEFDENWMQQTFESFWEEYGQWATAWSNMLLQPPTPSIQKLLKEAECLPSLATRLAEGFNHPRALLALLNNEMEQEERELLIA